jgi:plastocyanin
MTLAHRTWRLVLALGLLFVAVGTALPALAKDVGLSIVDKSFEPANITVNAGDVLTWTVTKSIGEPHSVTSGKPGDTATPLFDSGLDKLKDNGSTYQVTFDTPGTFAYFCTVHPDVMKGEVLVLPAGEPAGGAGEAGAGIAPERKLIAAGILAATLIVLFGAAWVWRRMNPA